MTLTARRTAGAKRRSAFTLLEVLVVVAILVVLAGVASIYVFRYLDDAKKDKARLDIKNIEVAVKAYAIKNEGNFPESLQQLIAPPDGGKPFLEGGQKAITDPWDRLYNYEVTAGNGGEPQPLISTQPTDGSPPITNLTRR